MLTKHGNFKVGWHKTLCFSRQRRICHPKYHRKVSGLSRNRPQISINYLAIIPRARMGYESIAHEAAGRMGYWFRGYEGETNNCFSKIQVVDQKNIETKHLSQVKVTVDLQGCLPKNHSHARLLCYNYRKLYIIVKLVKFRIRRNNFFGDLI